MLFYQIWTLVYKTLLVAWVRRPLFTTIRAFFIPLTLVLIISYAQYFFNPPQHFGIGDPSEIHPLSSALSRSSSSRDTVAFAHSGLRGGAIDAVISSVAETCRQAGKKTVTVQSNRDIASVCKSSSRGSSNCYGYVPPGQNTYKCRVEERRI